MIPVAIGLETTPGSPLLVNLDRPPLLAAMREGTVRDEVAALKKKGIGVWGSRTRPPALNWAFRRLARIR